MPGCDKTTRRANHQKYVQPFAQKYFRCPVGQIRSLTPAILSHQGALAIVANEGQGAVDAKAATDERGHLRTAKSFGSDAPVLASSWRKRKRTLTMVARKPVTRTITYKP